MIFTVKKEEVFIPAWNGNKDLPEKEQVKVVIHLPSAADFAAAYEGVENHAEAEFYAYVKDVQGLEVDGEKATPKMVYHTDGLTSLVFEIKKRYLDYSIDKKK